MMVYNAQNCWGLDFVHPQVFRKTTEHRVSEMDLFCQWLRLALSKGPNRVSVSPLTWGRKQIRFQNTVFSIFLQYRTMDKFQRPGNSECTWKCLTAWTIFSSRFFKLRNQVRAGWLVCMWNYFLYRYFRKSSSVFTIADNSRWVS
jgi:hypothetical protein